jgi:hypothetical protein
VCIPRNGPISATIFAEFTAQWRGKSEHVRGAGVGNDVMNKDSNGKFGILIGGVVAVIAAIFILSGGELGGKKTVEGDQDLPPISTTDK